MSLWYNGYTKTKGELWMDNHREYKRGDIVLADLGNAVGSEQGGVRPVLVTQNDVGNKHSPTLIVAPITSKYKKKLPTHIQIGTECGLEVPSIALFEQTRTIDKSRVIKALGHKELSTGEDRCIMIAFGCLSFLSERDRQLVTAR